MNAGRELDGLVAEKVMGWHRQPYERPVPGIPFRPEWFDALQIKTGRFAEGDGGDYYHPDEEWEPSERLDHAWEVVAVLRERGWKYVFHSNAYGGWTAVMYRLSEAETSAGVFELFYLLGTARDHYRLHAEISALVTNDANTLPEAICLAALQAVDATAAEV